MTINSNENKTAMQEILLLQRSDNFCSLGNIFLHSPVMIRRRTFSLQRLLFFVPLLILMEQPAASQEHHSSVSSTWLILQTIPSLTWISLPAQINFALEWEATPVLYSFGMNRLDPRWHFMKVTQPERFAGSMEFNISAQLYTSKIGSSHWGFSGQIVTHLPLIERGEYLGLHLGAARYTIAGLSSTYLLGGVSTLFGFLHYTIKYSPVEIIWMHSVEFRFF